jgi:type IV pilus assembly protein PilC
MPNFEYEVMDRELNVRNGQAEALADGALRDSLKQQGFFVLNIRRAHGEAASVALSRVQEKNPIGLVWGEMLKRLVYRVKITELVLFSGQLAVMVESGLHLLRSLKALAGETINKNFKNTIDQVAADIEAGSTLAGALEKHPWAFDKIYVSLARAGEESGQLPAVLNQLTVYLEKTAYLRQKIVAALSYPIIILSVTTIILFVMVIKIVPIFEGVYSRVNATLPAPTLMLIAVSQVIRSNILMTLLLMVLVGVGFYFVIQSDRGRYLLDQFKLSFPIFGPLIRKAAVAKVCRTLSTLIQSGVPLLVALEISAEVAGNSVIQTAIHQSIAKVREGGTIAESFRQSGQFPALVTQMVATGEETGQLPAMLGKSALYYEQQVDATVNALSTLLEPILIVFMGLIGAGIIVSLYLPIFNLGRAVRSGGGAF